MKPAIEMKTTTIPKYKSLDSSFALLKEGFPFIQKRSKRLGSDIFQIRMLMQNVICMTGEEAAKVFYDPEKFERRKAIPKRIQKTLTGRRGVQTLDSEEHRHRKEMFMSLMNGESIGELMLITREHWRRQMAEWPEREKVVLFEEVKEILCKAACEWVGIPLRENEIKRRTKDLWAMVDAFGAIGFRHWKGRFARGRMQRWIGKIIHQVRENNIEIPKNSPAEKIIFHEDLNGNFLDTRTAAVEIINLLRPIVAISNFITFSAFALNEHPHLKNRIRESEAYIDMFVQEVRRFYPFAPFVGARVKETFIWRGFRLKKGTLVFLDIYGTNHDPRIWERHKEFWPGHFGSNKRTPFSFIPQGGGNYITGHRCAGEQITIELMKVAIDILIKEIVYQVPEQELSYDLKRIPSVIKSGFIINKIRISNPSQTPTAKKISSRDFDQISKS
jgi:fatty-acid peroxygenase